MVLLKRIPTINVSGLGQTCFGMLCRGPNVKWLMHWKNCWSNSVQTSWYCSIYIFVFQIKWDSLIYYTALRKEWWETKAKLSIMPASCSHVLIHYSFTVLWVIDYHGNTHIHYCYARAYEYTVYGFVLGVHTILKSWYILS